MARNRNKQKQDASADKGDANKAADNKSAADKKGAPPDKTVSTSMLEPEGEKKSYLDYSPPLTDEEKLEKGKLPRIIRFFRPPIRWIMLIVILAITFSAALHYREAVIETAPSIPGRLRTAITGRKPSGPRKTVIKLTDQWSAPVEIGAGEQLVYSLRTPDVSWAVRFNGGKENPMKPINDPAFAFAAFNGIANDISWRILDAGKQGELTYTISPKPVPRD